MAAVGDSEILTAQFSDRRGTPYAAILGKLVQPEFLLPVQYNDLVRKSRVIEGEIRLLLAVLKDALRTYIKTMHGKTGRSRRLFIETQRWFQAENQVGPFAYHNICEALGLEPELLRKWLRSLRTDGGE